MLQDTANPAITMVPQTHGLLSGTVGSGHDLQRSPRLSSDVHQSSQQNTILLLGSTVSRRTKQSAIRKSFPCTVPADYSDIGGSAQVQTWVGGQITSSTKGFEGGW